jgi:hypothetical protein
VTAHDEQWSAAVEGAVYVGMSAKLAALGLGSVMMHDDVGRARDHVLELAHDSRSSRRPGFVESPRIPPTPPMRSATSSRSNRSSS